MVAEMNFPLACPAAVVVAGREALRRMDSTIDGVPTSGTPHGPDRGGKRR